MAAAKGATITVFLSEHLQTFGPKICRCIRNKRSVSYSKRHYSSNSKTDHFDIKEVIENVKLGFIGANGMSQALGRGFISTGEMFLCLIF